MTALFNFGRPTVRLPRLDLYEPFFEYTYLREVFLAETSADIPVRLDAVQRACATSDKAVYGHVGAFQ